MLLCAQSPFSLFIWLNRAVHICILVALLVNYAICVSCHSRLQSAPLSRLYVWTASNLVLCCSEHDVNFSMTWLKGMRKYSTLRSSLIAHLGISKSKRIIRHCASWLQFELAFTTVALLSIKCRLHYDGKNRYFVWDAPGLNYTYDCVKQSAVFNRVKMNELSLNHIVAQHIHKA